MDALAVFWHSSSTSKFEDRSIFGLSDRAAKSLAFSGRRKCVISKIVKVNEEWQRICKAQELLEMELGDPQRLDTLIED
jgi:hypothetical protein